MDIILIYTWLYFKDLLQQYPFVICATVVFFIALGVHRSEKLERKTSGLVNPKKTFIAGLLYFGSAIGFSYFAGQAIEYGYQEMWYLIVAAFML